IRACPSPAVAGRGQYAGQGGTVMQRFRSIFRRSAAAVAVAGVLVGTTVLTPAAQAQEKVRIALGDVVSVETLAFLIALERAKDRGVEYEMTSFSKEELAVQSIVNGQADLGVGTPYSVIQKSKVPLKVVFQMSRLVFFPVASIEYKTWKDLRSEEHTSELQSLM